MRDWVDPLIFTYAQTSLAKPNYVNLRRAVNYLVVLDCSRECRIYADDSLTKLIVHLTPGSSGLFEVMSPAHQLVIVWKGTALEYLATDIVLFSYLSAEEPTWSLTPGIANTIYQQWLAFGVPSPPILTVDFPLSVGFTGALGFMVEPQAIESATEIRSHALTAAMDDILSRKQVLAVGIYKRTDADTATLWDGSVAVTGTVSVAEPVTIDGSVSIIGTVPVSFNEPVNVSEDIAAHYFASTGQQTSVMTAATAEQQFTIYNPSGSGKVIRIWGIDYYVSSASAATDLAILAIRTTNVPSAGTAETRVAYDTNNAASIASVITKPTVAVAGSAFARMRYALGITGAVPVLNPPPVTPWIPLFHDLPDGFKRSGLVRRETEGISIQVTPTNNSTIIWAIRAYWTEE